MKLSTCPRPKNSIAFISFKAALALAALAAATAYLAWSWYDAHHGREDFIGTPAPEQSTPGRASR